MADIRINSETLTTATSAAADDYMVLDGATNGTRKILGTDVGSGSYSHGGGDALTRSVQDKLREIPSPNDYTTYGGAFWEADQWLFPGTGQITRTTAINLIGDRSVLGGRFLNNTPAQLFQGTADDFLMLGTRSVYGEGEGLKYFLQMASGTAASDLIFSHLNVEAEGYAILVNYPANGRNLIVANSHLKSDNSDAVQINTYDGNYENVIVVGCTAEGGPNADNPAAGMGIGFAGSSNSIAAANVTYDSRYYAYHIEDQSLGGVFVGNVGARCKGQGVNILRRPSLFDSITDPNDGAIVVGNYMHGLDEDHSLRTDDEANGVFHVYDQNGSHSVCSIVGNRVRSFKNGFSIGEQLQALVGNAAIDCDVAVRLIGRDGMTEGTTIARDCPTMVRATPGAWLERVASDTPPTSILVSTTGASTKTVAAGLTRGFAYLNLNASLAHTGASAVIWFDLFAAADIMDGKLIVQATNGTFSTEVFADIQYDGTIFEVRSLKGSLTSDMFSLNIRLSSGKVQLGIGKETSITFTKIKVDFQGQYFNWPSDVEGLFIQNAYTTTTTTNLGDAANAINTTGKRLGRRVYNTTNDKFLIAAGSATTDQWIYEDASTPITPS